MGSPRRLRIVSRKSRLALWQAEFVKQQLLQHHPDLDITILSMSTQGDKMLDAPLAKVGGKGLFVKELEQCLLSGEADIAVHSLKDVPVELPELLHLPCILKRHSPHDAWVSRHNQGLSGTPNGAVIGTSSLRRQCQLRAVRPDLTIKMLRGNVNTRLKKLDDGEFDAIILAQAGLDRLQLQTRVTETLAITDFLPAVGQGALGIECRVKDKETNTLLATLHDDHTAHQVHCERAMNQALKGGCQVPIAGFAQIEANQLSLKGLVGDPDSGVLLHAESTGMLKDALDIGQRVAADLLAQGADSILERVYRDYGGA